MLYNISKVSFLCRNPFTRLFLYKNSFIRNLVVASSKIKKLLLLQNISTFGIRNFFYFLQKNNPWLEEAGANSDGIHIMFVYKHGVIFDDNSEDYLKLHDFDILLLDE